MTTEEKAKSYDEALERANKIDTLNKEYLTPKEAKEYIFPELAESEDERIVKAIERILYENYSDAAVIDGFEIAEIVTWLEKQKEQKPRKFKVGDIVTNGEYTYTIDYIGSDCYWLKEHDCATISFAYEDNWQVVEQKPAEWSKKINVDEMVAHYACTEQEGFGKPVNCMVRAYKQGILDILKSTKPAEWSEEDEEMFKACIAFIADEKFKGYEKSYECIDWLKFLPSRFALSHWKPSEEQMRILAAAVEESNENLVLGSLYNDLKKL